MTDPFKAIGAVAAATVRRVAETVEVGKLSEGYFRTRLVKGGVYVPVRVWYGPPADPVTGELLDRSLRWQALRDNTYVDPWTIWPPGERITKAEYDYLVSMRAWAKEHAPEDPYADPTKPVDLDKIAPIEP